MTTPTNDASSESTTAPLATKSEAKGAKPKTRRAGIVVEHRVRGRTRIRLGKEHRTPEKMAAIQEELNKNPDITSVKINQRSGSVTIEHAHHRDGRELIKESFEGVEILAGLLLEVPVGGDEEGGEDGEGRLDRKLAEIVTQIDEWQAQKTHIRGRGVLVSGAVAALGVAQIAIYGISLEMLPGPMLLYIAYDIHRKVREDEMALEGRGKKAAKKADESTASTAKGLQPAAT
jgi:hypothetical protein